MIRWESHKQIGWGVPNFLKDVPKGSIVRPKVLIISDHFLMGSQWTIGEKMGVLVVLRLDVPIFTKDVPNFVKDVPRVQK